MEKSNEQVKAIIDFANSRIVCAACYPEGEVINGKCQKCGASIDLRIYDHDHRNTELGSEIEIQIHKLIEPLFHGMVAAGVSPRELSHFLMALINEMELLEILGYGAVRGSSLPKETDCKR